MAAHSAHHDDISAQLRLHTPPPISGAVEYLSASSLVQNIAILLSVPRETTARINVSKTGARSRRASKAAQRSKKAHGRASKPAQLSSWQHARHSSLSIPQSPIDTLAAVASAESLAHAERPTKRARSEMLASPDRNGYHVYSASSRPATSHLSSHPWGVNLESAIQAAGAFESPRIAYTSDEQIVADSLLDLFRRVPDSPAGPPRAGRGQMLEIPKWRTTQSRDAQLAKGAWGDAIDNDLDQSTITNGLVRHESSHARTPPEDEETVNRQDQLPRYGSPTLAPGAAILEANASGYVDLSSHKPHPQQLRSPQSLAADVDKIKVKKRKGRVKRESISAHQGLGISITPSNGDGNHGHMAADASKDTIMQDQEANYSKPTLATEKPKQVDDETECVKCGFSANSMLGDTMDWLQCNGCSGWLHFACTTFNKKEIERIDKFFCANCRPLHGPTTFVRKSARNRTNVDYSSLNEGFFSTVEEHHEHRYVKHFKARDMKHILPETFPRIAPEDLTIEYLRHLPAMDEPIVVPRELNPRPWADDTVTIRSGESSLIVPQQEDADFVEQELEEDVAQDKLGMVIPEGLTVRRVAEIHGSFMPLEVIDVKLQEGDSRKWTVGKWADYYEAPGDKAIRNVISLEVSYSPLGKLLRRPQVVRDLDLQDAVWPDSDLLRKAVKFYVLMSVADCYTDFHIDFGGSSVYYHVLKGKKVFFFIPPTKQNLKKYEDWCISPAQSETFLPDQTKECYRIDLEEGDTMLIPSGWIHAVWTPTDSLVIGGNFLTRLHLGMQIRINELEKNTGVETKFRYPFFQKVQWYTVLDYLEQDSIPAAIEQELLAGQIFDRVSPVWTEIQIEPQEGESSGPVRLYAKSEVEGWPDLLQFVLRTVLIHLDKLEGITKKTRAAVSRSIPKTVGNPLATVRKFACWIAWKTGNMQIPDWAFPGATLPSRLDVKIEKVEKPFAIPSEPRVTRRANSITIETKTSHRLGPKKVVCDNCREKKVACKHVDAHTLAKLTEGDMSDPSDETIETEPNGDGVVSKQRDREIVGRLSLTADGKRRWGKACVECRRSKRRCIHDETGKIDPHKQKQLAAALRNLTSGNHDVDDYDAMLAAYGSGDLDIDPALLGMADDDQEELEQDLVHQLEDAANAAADDDKEDTIDPDLPVFGGHAVESQAPLPNGQGHEMSALTSGVMTKDATTSKETDIDEVVASGDAKRASSSPINKKDRPNKRQSLSPTINKKARKGSREPLVLPATATPEEQESFKIAMALQAQEFGLRSRRSVGS